MFACVARSFSQVVLGPPLDLVPCMRPLIHGLSNANAITNTVCKYKKFKTLIYFAVLMHHCWFLMLTVQMVSREDHSSLWLDTMVTRGLDVILQRVRTSVDDSIACGCACVLRTLTRHEIFAPHILKHALDDINGLKSRHGRMRVGTYF